MPDLPAEELGRHVSRVDEHDEEVLGEFGYKQELRRDWGLMHNFGISFSIIVSSLSFFLLRVWMFAILRFFWGMRLRGGFCRCRWIMDGY